jgi:transposase-like protein
MRDESDEVRPRVKFCPYCGSDQIKIVKWTPRCMRCRSTFSVSYGRKLRRKPSAKTTKDPLNDPPSPFPSVERFMDLVDAWHSGKLIKKS